MANLKMRIECDYGETGRYLVEMEDQVRTEDIVKTIGRNIAASLLNLVGPENAWPMELLEGMEEVLESKTCQTICALGMLSRIWDGGDDFKIGITAPADLTDRAKIELYAPLLKDLGVEFVGDYRKPEKERED